MTGERRIHIVQGECFTSAEPNVLLTTTLGSCIAACIRDPLVGVGGMNHFLLPDGGPDESAATLRYGAFAMEQLVNEILKAGGVRGRLVAKLFGGARLTRNSIDVGAANAAFASDFLKREGVMEAPGSLGGDFARRLQFWPASGRIRQQALRRPVEAVPLPTALPPKMAERGVVELF